LRTFLVAFAAFALDPLLIAFRTAHILAIAPWILTARLRFAFPFLVRLLVVRHVRQLLALPTLAETT
jgi:hypothetical protein